MSQVRKPKRLAARSFRLFLASSDNARPSRKSSLSLKSFMRSIAFRLHSRKFVMYEFRCAKEHAIARTFHKDRKSTRLNSSHVSISYAVFCLKKKNSDYKILYLYECNERFDLLLIDLGEAS